MVKKSVQVRSGIRFGAPCYINTLPLLYALQKKIIPNNFAFILAPPTAINKLFSEGELDIAITSTPVALSEKYVPFGIAAEKKVHSVLLFVRKKMALDNIERIGVPVESAASVALLRIITSHFWNIEPQFVPFQTVQEATTFDAFLLIGDPCLTFTNRQPYDIYDLAEVWVQSTGTPCTFAMTSICDIDPSALLHASLDFAAEHPALILAEAHRRTKLPRKQLMDYFSSLSYVLSENHIEGLKLYEVLSKQTSVNTCAL